MSVVSKQIFDNLYEAVDGIEISNRARNDLSYYYSGHIYGEITYEGFTSMLEVAKPKGNEVFYDLGSGTGKAVILAALLHSFSKVAGIEILTPLHQSALSVINKSQPEVFKTSLSSIQFINGDFKDIDFSDADIIFLNATCYHYEMTNELLEKFERLKKGSRIVTSTIQIPLPSFMIETLGQFPFTWGPETVYLHTKNG